MDNRRYQELRTYCMDELGESMSLPGYEAVMQVAVKAGGDTGRIKREEQLARSLFQCHDLTTRERAAAYLLAVITNHRIATWQREPSPPSGQESMPPLDTAQADELARVTRDAVTRYAALLPDREAAVLLADCETAPGPPTAPVEPAGAFLTRAQESATSVVIQINGREAVPVRAIPLLTDWHTMTSLENYTLWNDYHTLKSVNRQGAITRANSDANARATQSSIDNANRTINDKSYNCKPNYSGTALNCN